MTTRCASARAAMPLSCLPYALMPALLRARQRQRADAARARARAIYAAIFFDNDTPRHYARGGAATAPALLLLFAADDDFLFHHVDAIIFFRFMLDAMIYMREHLFFVILPFLRCFFMIYMSADKRCYVDAMIYDITRYDFYLRHGGIIRSAMRARRAREDIMPCLR